MAKPRKQFPSIEESLSEIAIQLKGIKKNLESIDYREELRFNTGK